MRVEIGTKPTKIDGKLVFMQWQLCLIGTATFAFLSVSSQWNQNLILTGKIPSSFRGIMKRVMDTYIPQITAVVGFV